MSMNYRLADLIAQIKNAQNARLAKINVKYTRFLEDVCKVLKEEGYIENCLKKEAGKNKFDLEVALKYHDGERAIHDIFCVSKPGRRVYSQIENMPKQNNGLGISIISTSKGVKSDFDARKANVGGEILCTVF